MYTGHWKAFLLPTLWTNGQFGILRSIIFDWGSKLYCKNAVLIVSLLSWVLP